jgi:hypothetical protein
MQQDAADATKTVSFDLTGCSAGADNVLDFNSTVDRTYTFPDVSATVVLTLGVQEIQDKTVKNGFLDGTKIRNNALDVEAAGALTFGASMGANTMTLGGATSTVSIPGNLTVSGTTTTVDTVNLDVKDKNILVNKGGNDEGSEGSGLTIDRIGTKGSLIYKASANSKFAAGDLGSEKNLAAIDDINVDQLSGTLLPSKGGTGIANDDAATLTRSGNHAVTLTTTGVTGVTLPTSGTLATTADITMANLTGTLVPSKGGTGVSNNDAATLTRTGNFDLNITTTAATGVTLPTAGTLATLEGSEQLSSKTLVEPVVDNFAAFNQESTPTAAAAGTVRVYAKADNKLYKMDSTGAEAAIGSGSGSGSGAVNYLVDWYDSSKPVGTVLTVAANGNIVVSGSAPLVTSAWYADATSGAAAIAASTSTLLRGSSNYLTALSGASTSGATFVQSAVFNIDGSDLGKPVTISFDVSGVTTADDWDVIVARYTVSDITGTFAELIPVAGTASSMTGTPGAQLPTGTVQFKGFFIPSATSTDVYALRLRRRAGATQIRVDSLTVGPQSLAQGAVVTGWQDYTPTFNGFGTTTGIDAKWRRVGSSLQAQIKFTSGTLQASTTARISIPSGLTIDSSIANKIIGTSTTQFSVTSGQNNSCLIFVESGQTTNVSFCNIGDGSSTKNLSGLNSQTIFGSNAPQSVQFEVPIAEWAGSGTTTLATRAVEEYAYNTSTSTNTSDTTSFGYGVQGAQIQNITAGLSRRVRFQTPILPTDKFCLEISINRINWQDVSYRFGDNATSDIVPLTRQISASYGIGYIVPVNSTDIDITFGQYAEPSNATYGGIGRLWSVGAGSWYWRLRKISGGAAVGYPVSARNIVGDTSGSVVPTGMLGEVLTATLSNVLISPTATAVTVGTLNLTPGTWQVFAKSMWSASSGASTATYYRVSISTILGSEHLASANAIFNSSGVPDFYVSPCPRIISTASNQAIYMVALGQFTGTAQTTDASRSQFYAVRIA